MRITLLMTLATALSCGTGKTKLTEDVDPNRDPLPESDTADSGAADSGSSPTDDTASTTDTSTTDTASPDTGTTDSGTTDTGPAPCIADPATPGEDTALSLTHDGETRTYMVRLPADYDCTPRPVLIGVHGYYGSGSGFANSTAELSEHLDTHGYIGLFPDGLPMSASAHDVTSFNDLGSRFDGGPDGPTCDDDPWDYGSYDNCGSDEIDRECHWGTSCADDEGFFRAMLAHAQETWSVDASRIYMTGFSQGGQTVQSMACPMSDVLAAIAPSHGFSANGHTCAPETPMAMIQVWGERDRIVPGDDGLANDGYIYDDAAETASVWAEAQGCASDGSATYATGSDGARGWACTEHVGCATGADVVTCQWDGGHIWPTSGEHGNFPLAEIWTFLSAHTR
jgi:polyhydroxybutyrate depolymerase